MGAMGPPAANTPERRQWNDARNEQRVQERLATKREQLLPALKRELVRAQRKAANATAGLRAARTARTAAAKKQKALAGALKKEKTAGRCGGARCRAGRHDRHQ